MARQHRRGEVPRHGLLRHDRRLYGRLSHHQELLVGVSGIHSQGHAAVELYRATIVEKIQKELGVLKLFIGENSYLGSDSTSFTMASMDGVITSGAFDMGEQLVQSKQ